MKIFFAVSYSSEVDTHGNIFPEFRKIEEMLAALEADGSTVYCAPRKDDWKLNSLSPGEAVTSDLQNIDDSDVFIALLDEVISAGVQLELGYALAKKKKILIAATEDRHISYFVRGLVGASRVAMVLYETPGDLVTGFRKATTNGSQVHISID